MFIALYSAVYWSNEELPRILLLVGVVGFVRAMTAGLRDRGTRLVARKFLRNISLKKQDVVSIRFQRRGISAAKRLVVETMSGETVHVTGVSIWSFFIRLPWQNPDKRLLQLERFLARSNLAEVYSAP